MRTQQVLVRVAGLVLAGLRQAVPVEDKLAPGCAEVLRLLLEADGYSIARLGSSCGRLSTLPSPTPRTRVWTARPIPSWVTTGASAISFITSIALPSLSIIKLPSTRLANPISLYKYKPRTM